MPFKKIPVIQASRLINHGPTVLVTSRAGDRINVMTASWQMPVSFRPPLVAVAIGHGRWSHGMVMEGREFVVNVPSVEIVKAVWCCGGHSGRDTDKFKVCNLTPVKGQKVGAPLIEECIGNIECRLHSHLDAGDHTIFVGEMVAASVKEGLFDEHLRVDLDQAKTIHHLGGRTFCSPGKVEVV